MTLQITNINKNVSDLKKELLQVQELTEVEERYSLSALRIFKERYLLKDNNGNTCERLDELFKRVAVGVGIMEILYDKEFYDKEGKQCWTDDKDIQWCEKELISEQNKNSNIDYKTMFKEMKLGCTWGEFNINPFHYERLLARYIELLKEGKMKVGFSTINNVLFFPSNDNKYLPLIQKYYDLMANKIFLPNTPALMNIGNKLSQGSACFVLGVEDDIESIADLYKDQILIFKSGGGVGANYSKLRPKGDIIKSTGGVSSGVISFMSVVDKITDVVKSGGKRKGANMGLLNSSHPEILDFITAKNNDTKLLQNFNISLATDDSFFNAFLNNIDYELKFNDKIYDKINAIKMMNMITENVHHTADPGLVFLDNMNINNLLNDVLGPITSCNPCVTANTRLATSKGLIKMEDLYLSGQQLHVTTDNRTISNNKELGIQSRTAVPVFKTSNNADVWIVETENGNIVEATDYHKFFIQKQSTRNDNKIQLRELKDLKIGDILLVQSDKGYFGSQGSKELGAAIGWVQADGTTSKSKNKKEKKVLDFYHEKKELAPQFLKYVNSILPLSKNGNKVHDISIHNEETNRNICTIQSQRLDIFETYNIVKNSVPEFMWCGTEECITSYLQALFTADGTIFGSLSHHNFSIRLSNICHDFLREIQILLNNFGINSKIRLASKACKKMMPKNDGTGNYQLYDCKDAYELIIGKSRHTFIKEIGFLLKSKQEKAESFSKSIGSDLRTSDFTTRIKSITYKGKEPVYDTTEPSTHTIIVNGIVTSQCQEENLYDNESCNLGSINISKFISNNRFDLNEYIQTIKITTQFLDSVIDYNKYPTEKTDKMSKQCRRIGLGYMGLADTLVKLGIPYNCKEGFIFTEYITAIMTMISLSESNRLSGYKGSFPLWYNSNYPKNKLPVNALINHDDKDELENNIKCIGEFFNSPDDLFRILERAIYLIDFKKGLRNCNVTCIAPTGTLSMFTDCSSGIEPIFSKSFTKNVTLGEFEYNNVSDNLITAMEIHPFDHIMMQAVAQKWISNSISKTINCPSDTVQKLIEYSYMLAWALKCKGISLYRNGSKDVQVLNNNDSSKVGINNMKISEYTENIIRDLNNLSQEYKDEILGIETFTFWQSGTKLVDQWTIDELENTNVMRCPNCNETNSLQKNGRGSECFICVACSKSMGTCD